MQRPQPRLYTTSCCTGIMELNAKSLAAIAIPFMGGFPGSLVQRRVMDSFYRVRPLLVTTLTKTSTSSIQQQTQKLKKPWFCPPEKAFPIVWTSLYASMGYASYLVYRDGGGFDGPARVPLMIYGAKLLVNFAFTPVFFGLKQLGWVSQRKLFIHCWSPDPPR